MSRSFGVTDPIASEMGHGRPGLRYWLRPLDELVTASASQKQAFFLAKPGRLVSGVWTSASGAYSTPCAETWGGVLRDVVGVEYGAGTITRATRMETLALCQATNDTYFWDEDAGTLYLRKGAGADPTNTDVVIRLSFPFGSHGVAHPSWGPEKLSDPGLEVWTTSSDLTSWSENVIGAGGGSVSRDAGIDGAGAYAVKLDGTFNATGGRAIAQTHSFVVGKTYRLSGWVETDPANPTTLLPVLSVYIGSVYLTSDGRSVSGSDSLMYMPVTYGRRTRFTFDFVAPSTDASGVVTVGIYNTTGSSATGTAWYDGLSLRRVYRYDFFEPRIALDSLPVLETKAPDSWFGAVARAAGSITVLNGRNGGAYLEAPLAGLDWEGAEVEIRSGGRFVDGGNETLWEDCAVLLSGVVTAQPRLTDHAASFSVEDQRASFSVPLPPNTYDGLAIEEKDRRRPLIFGAVVGVKPALTSESGYGTFELADMSSAPGLLHAVVGAPIDTNQPTVYSYLDEEAAQHQDTTRRIGFSVGDEGVQVSLNKSTGALTFAKCPLPIEVTSENNCFDFNIGGGTLTAVVPPGIYGIGEGHYMAISSDDGLLKALISAIRTAAGAGGYTGTFSGAYKVTISKDDGGTFQILAATGPNNARGIYRLLGFSGTGDFTGALSYTGADALWLATSPRQLVLRVACNGFLDDGSGTYTGSANGLIQLAPDVVRCLLVRWLGVDPAAIDTASFVAGRLSTPRPVSMYLGALGEDVLEASLVIERLCNGAGADLSFEGGRWYWRVRDRTRPASAVELQERDYFAHEAGYDSEDIVSLARVGYAQDPATAAWTMVQQTSSRVTLRTKRKAQKTWPTYLASAADASVRLSSLAGEAQVPRRRWSITTKGKALLLPLQTKVLLTRARGLDASGALNQVLARIVGKADNPVDWTSRLDLIEVMEMVALGRWTATATVGGTGAWTWDTERLNSAPGSMARQSSNTQIRLAAGTYLVTVTGIIAGLAAGSTGAAIIYQNATEVDRNQGVADAVGNVGFALSATVDAVDGDYIRVQNANGNRFGDASPYTVLNVVKLT